MNWTDYNRNYWLGFAATAIISAYSLFRFLAVSDNILGRECGGFSGIGCILTDFIAAGLIGFGVFYFLVFIYRKGRMVSVMICLLIIFTSILTLTSIKVKQQVDKEMIQQKASLRQPMKRCGNREIEYGTDLKVTAWWNCVQNNMNSPADYTSCVNTGLWAFYYVSPEQEEAAKSEIVALCDEAKSLSIQAGVFDKSLSIASCVPNDFTYMGITMNETIRNIGGRGTVDSRGRTSAQLIDENRRMIDEYRKCLERFLVDDESYKKCLEQSDYQLYLADETDQCNRFRPSYLR